MLLNARIYRKHKVLSCQKLNEQLVAVTILKIASMFRSLGNELEGPCTNRVIRYMLRESKQWKWFKTITSAQDQNMEGVTGGQCCAPETWDGVLGIAIKG